MSKLVKDFIEIRDIHSLDALVERLSEIRDALPDSAQPQVKMIGDDNFGRSLQIVFLRPQSAEEMECDARYFDAYRTSRERELSRLQDELNFCPLSQRRGGRLRIVA